MTVRVGIMLTPVLFAIAPASLGQSAVALRNHQFTVLKGTTVENNDGERLGTLKDFVFDGHSGRVEFAIIKSGGFGPMSKQRIAPAFGLSLSSIKKHTLSLDVTDTRWGNAPLFT